MLEYIHTIPICFTVSQDCTALAMVLTIFLDCPSLSKVFRMVFNHHAR